LHLLEYNGVPRPFESGQRYLVVPYALFAWILLSRLSNREGVARLPRAVLWLALAAMAVNSSRQFVSPWYPAADWPAACAELRAGRPSTIHVAPYDTAVTIPP
jgi:hypothetical protein